MKRDLILTKPLTSSFLSCEKDTELILRKLFVQSRPYSDTLKSLLIIQAPDCLDNMEKYKEKLDSFSIARMVDEGYIQFDSVVKNKEHEQVKARIHVYFDNFSKDYTNPEFRDCEVHFEVIVHHDQSDLGNYRQRALKIVGYIDGLLNNTKLTGIGTLQFQNCFKTTTDENYGGYTLVYQATHGSDDQINNEDE